MITNVEYSVTNQFNFTFDCEKTCIIYCLRIIEFNIASCPKSSYLHEDFQNFRSLRYTNDERYYTIKQNSRQIQYDYVIYSNVITLREHLDSHPPDFGGVRGALLFGFLWVFRFCLSSSCVLCVRRYHWIIILDCLFRLSLTFIWCIYEWSFCCRSMCYQRLYNSR